METLAIRSDFDFRFLGYNVHMALINPPTIKYANSREKLINPPVIKYANLFFPFFSVFFPLVFVFNQANSFVNTQMCFSVFFPVCIRFQLGNSFVNTKVFFRFFSLRFQLGNSFVNTKVVFSVFFPLLCIRSGVEKKQGSNGRFPY